MKPIVSIIVPIYNVELYLAECVESIRNQTVKEIEIILVDDGSPDGCPEMCDRFAAEDERIRVIHQENAGVSAARNRGMEMAAGEWIMFADPDDWLESDAVEVLYRQAKAGGCDMVCASCYKNYPDKQVQYGMDSSQAGKYVVEKDFEILFGSFLRGGKIKINMASPCAKLYRKSMLDAHTDCRFPDGMKMGQDFIFNMYAFQNAGNIYVLNVPVFHYRIRPGSTTTTIHSDQPERYRRLIEEIHACMAKYQRLDQFLPDYYYACVCKVWTFSIQYGKHVRSVQDFRTAASQLKTLCGGVRIAEAITKMKAESLSGKIVLWLLRHYLYGCVMLLAYAGSRIRPEAWS